jgi:hypothetical protein
MLWLSDESGSEMIRVTLSAKLVPQTGTPGDIWIPNDCRRIFVVGDNSKVIDVTAALDGGLFRSLSVELIEHVKQLQEQVDELLAQHRNGQDYVEHLRAKIATRGKA